MMKVTKKLLIVMLITIMLGATIINCSNAATSTAALKDPRPKENMINGDADANKSKPIEQLLNEAKLWFPLLKPGENMKLNRAPGFDFEKAKKGSKIDVTITDGTGIYTINGTNLDTKKNLKEIKFDKKGVQECVTQSDEPAKGKTRFMEYIAKDHTKYSNKVQVKVKKDEKNNDTFNVSMRVNFSTDANHKYLNILLRDNAGINAPNAAIEIYDRNQKDEKGNVKRIAAYQGSDIKVNYPVIKNGKIIYGMTKLSMKELKKNKDGKYVVTIKTVDNTGLKGYRTAEFSF